jgi:acetyl-CoA synthetase
VVGAIEWDIDKIARPKAVWIVADMPKTRSSKIMRRVVASISKPRRPRRHDHISNPEIVDSIRHQV